MIPEILAPAGGMPQLIAAVRCGCGAVYLGAKGFNARRNAANFDEYTLPEAVSYCHARGVKVYVTVNTLIFDDEQEKLFEEGDLIARSGADGVIIQDLAVLDFFARRYPDIKRYASTQTAVHDLNGALQLEAMGFDGVVLARELTLREMERICSKVKVKTEAFIHGAHCMSVSGACYMSAMLGGRSGNRGLCAQPCRLDWRCGSKDHALSLKDMSLFAHAREMADVGVQSFKIEGRMKRPEYVAAAVCACKNALEGKPYDVETLKAVFSRSGFTDGYLTGKRDGTMYGVRTKEDVVGAEKVLKELESLYRAETPRVPVDMKLVLTEELSRLSVSDGLTELALCGPTPEKAINRPLDRESAEKSLSKTGGTPFYASVECLIEPGLTLPASALNKLRRDALDELLRRRSSVSPHLPTDAVFTKAPPHKASGKAELWARFWEPGQIPENRSIDRIILPCEKITPELISKYREKLTGQLPPMCFPDDEEKLEQSLKALRQAGLSEVLADNIYGVRLGKKHGFSVRGGFGLNITNTWALESFAELGLKSATVSFETSMAKIKSLGGELPRGAVCYGALPLMHFRNCPKRAHEGCASCSGSGSLCDRLGIVFPLECHEKKFSVLLNSVPLHVADKDLRGLDHVLLYFTRESARECEKIVDDFVMSRKADSPRTGGLYYREVL